MFDSWGSFWRRLVGGAKADPKICPNCKRKPVAPKSATGKSFDYCSKACATQARKSKSSLRRARSQRELCEICKIRPKYVEWDGLVHPHCGRTCARVSQSTCKHPSCNDPSKSAFNGYCGPLHARAAVQAGPSANPPQPVSPGLTCQTPGCTSPVFVHKDGTPSKYCQMAHKKWGEQGCISCRAAPRNGPSILCQSCHTDALRRAPVIIKVPEGHENYKSVETQFKQAWRHTTACPEVVMIYKIIVTKANQDKYKQYLDNVEARGNFVAMGRSRGNENRRWHGTRRKCHLGDRGNTRFCTQEGCSLCCIIKSSFNLKFSKSATGWGRFGCGIYTSSTSSKSNDYSENVDINSDLKALLLNKVVVGNGKKLINDDTSLTAPPPGFDSVLAEAASGGSLNYDELIVYRNDAVRPSYLVMYKSS